MTDTITEEDIQKALKMLEKKDPKQATRENAIKAAQALKKMASDLLDKVDDDLKSGKLTVDDDGRVSRKSDDE